MSGEGEDLRHPSPRLASPRQRALAVSAASTPMPLSPILAVTEYGPRVVPGCSGMTQRLPNYSEWWSREMEQNRAAVQDPTGRHLPSRSRRRVGGRVATWVPTRQCWAACSGVWLTDRPKEGEGQAVTDYRYGLERFLQDMELRERS